jgi:hypothetical protein
MKSFKGERGMAEAADIAQAGALRRYQKPTLKKAQSLVNVTSFQQPPVAIGSGPMMTL